LIDRLEGKEVDCATPGQGMWAMIVASAAQQSVASGQAVSIDSFIVENALGTLLNEINHDT
jgi:hypothetical protein